MSFPDFNDLNDLLMGWVDGGYTRPIKEVQRYRIYNKDENTSILVANTLGVAREDLTVKMSGDILTIKGETKNPDTEDTSSVNYSFRLSREKKVSKLTWKNMDGFTYVYFHFEEPSEVAVEYAE